MASWVFTQTVKPRFLNQLALISYPL